MGLVMCEGMVCIYEPKAYFASTESCWSPCSVETGDFPTLAEGLGTSMSDDVEVLAGEDAHSVEGQDSAKTGSSSVAVKGRWLFSDSCLLPGLRLCNCRLDRCFERSGLKFCRSTTKWLKKRKNGGSSDVSLNICEVHILFFSLSLTGTGYEMGGSAPSPPWMLAGRDSALWTQVRCKNNTYKQLRLLLRVL